MLETIQKAEPGQLFLVVKHYARNSYFLQVTTTDTQGQMVPIRMLSVLFEDDAEKVDQLDPANSSNEKEAVFNLRGHLIKKLGFHDSRDLDFVVNMIKKLRYERYGSLLVARYDKNLGLLHHNSFIPSPKRYLMVEMSPFGKAANCAITDKIYSGIPATTLHINSAREVLFEVVIGEYSSHCQLFSENGVSSSVVPYAMWDTAYKAVCSLDKIKKGRFIFMWENEEWQQVDCVGF